MALLGWVEFMMDFQNCRWLEMVLGASVFDYFLDIGLGNLECMMFRGYDIAGVE